MGGKHQTKPKADSNKTRHHRKEARARGGKTLVLKQQVDSGKPRQQHQQHDQRQQQQQQHEQRQQRLQVEVERLQENMSFCGCGFLGMYHVGVASCFHEYAPQLSMHKISGSSVGSIVAVAHICGNLQLAYATTDILRIAIDARARALGPLHPSFDINAIIRDALQRGLPDDVHVRVSGKLHISLTRLDDLENVIVSKFESKEEVIQALICSCFIPCWSGFVAPKYKEVAYIDGGFSNNLLVLDDKTITVSPFAGEADICPQDDVYNLLTVSISNTSFSITPHNLYRLSHALIPPSPEMLSELCERGYADGIRFLQRMKLISCTKCLQIQSSGPSLLLSQETSCTTTTTTTTTTTEFIEQTTISAASTATGGLERASSCRSSYGNRDINNTTGSTKSATLTMQPLGEPNSPLANQHHFESLMSAYQDCCEEEEQQQQESEDEATSYLDADCDGCLMRRKHALRDALPKLFTDRIREACENVNKSLINWFYSHRPIQYLAYMAAPYYLPMNLSLALFLKYWQCAPQIGLQLYRYFNEFKHFFVEIAKRLLERSTTSLLYSDSMPGSGSGGGVGGCGKQVEEESSISVKITAACRSSWSLTSYECCLTIVLLGRQTLLSATTASK